MTKENWGTLYRLLMDGGRYSEKHVEKIQSQFNAADDTGRKALLKKYQGSTKKAGQNKALDGGDTKKAKPAAPSTPDKNEAFDPPKPTKRGFFSRKVTRGKKG